MKKWILKAVVQKTISYLPFSSRINYFFQKYITKGVFLSDEYFYGRLIHAREHLKGFSIYSNIDIPNSCLELGTGWYPVVPISFFLSSVKKTYSVDISFLTSKERIKKTIEKFVEAEERGLLIEYVPIKSENFEILVKLLKEYDSLSLEQILESINLIYLIEDARNLSLPDESIDLINSNNTFEHIYPEILTFIIKDFKRVCKKGGVMSHFIDMTDHFAHFDKSINIYNFLHYSDAQWKWIDNSIQPQSRLRIDDYKRIYESLDISISEQSYEEGQIEELKKIKLDKKYQNKPLGTIVISHCHFISKMKG